MRLAGILLLTGLHVAGMLPIRAAQHSIGTNDDLASVLRVSLKDMEFKCKGNTIVLPDGADSNLVEALSALHRKAIGKKDVPYSARDVLPSGYIQLVSISIVGDKAQFKGTLGPVGRANGRMSAWTCGTTVSISLAKVRGEWVVVEPEEATVC